VSAVPRPRAPYRLLVFDWDGTLIDSIGSIVACMHATVAELDLPAVDDDVVRGTIGLGLHETLEILLPGAGPDLHARVMECYRRHWLGGYADRHLLIRGAVEVLDELARDGYWLTVATGKSRRGLDRDLRRFGLADRFLASRTADETAGKPSPAMLFEILDELGVSGREALLVGDTVHDLRMAANAGVAAVAVASGSASPDELRGLGPLAVLPDVTHLPAWLRG
jgi:phosphoglycolate phosphatase